MTLMISPSPILNFNDYITKINKIKSHKTKIMLNLVTVEWLGPLKRRFFTMQYAQDG